jgi:hypothetical protein
MRRLPRPVAATLASVVTSHRFAPAQPVGAEFQVNTYTTYDQRAPDIGPDGAGGFVVVWESGGFLYGGPGPDGSSSGVQGQRYSSAGTAVGGEFQVNAYTTSGQLSPAVAPDGAGGFVVVWASFGGYGTDTSSTSVQGQRYSSTGTPAGSQFQVNTYTTGAQFLAAVGPDGGGGFVVVWESQANILGGQDGSGNAIRGQRYGSLGTPVGGEFQVNTYTTSIQWRPAVGSDGTGGFVVVWMGVGGIKGQRYDSTGTAVGGEFQVNAYTTSGQAYPDVGSDGTGGFVVVWASGGSSGSDTSSFSIQGAAVQ